MKEKSENQDKGNGQNQTRGFPIEVKFSAHMRLLCAFSKINMAEFFVRAIGTYLHQCGLGESFEMVSLEIKESEKPLVRVPDLQVKSNPLKGEKK